MFSPYHYCSTPSLPGTEERRRGREEGGEGEGRGAGKGRVGRRRETRRQIVGDNVEDEGESG